VKEPGADATNELLNQPQHLGVLRFPVLEFELRALCLQVCYHLSNTSALFALVIFQIGSGAFALASLDLDPPTYASCVAGVTDELHLN
jgi:hypothetical protein